MTLNLKNLLNPKVKISKMGEFQELQPIAGLELSAISADLYGICNGKLLCFNTISECATLSLHSGNDVFLDTTI